MRHSNICAGRNWKGLISGFWGLLFLFFVIFTLTGCDDSVFESIADDDSYEARIEEAKIAIDDANYAGARDLLLALNADFPNTAEVLRLLANAYAGLAGLDTFNLLETIDLLDDQNNEGGIDMIGLVLGSADGVLTATEITNKLANFANAINALTSISSPTDDERVQLGIMSLNHAALTIADIIIEDTGNTEITLTDEGLDTVYPIGTTPEFSTEATSERLTSISQNRVNIGQSVDAVSRVTGADVNNDISESLEEFQNDVDPDGNESVTQSELESYIANL
jgi:hypothetical protein